MLTPAVNPAQAVIAFRDRVQEAKGSCTLFRYLNLCYDRDLNPDHNEETFYTAQCGCAACSGVEPESGLTGRDVA